MPEGAKGSSAPKRHTPLRAVRGLHQCQIAFPVGDRPTHVRDQPRNARSPLGVDQVGVVGRLVVFGVRAREEMQDRDVGCEERRLVR